MAEAAACTSRLGREGRSGRGAWGVLKLRRILVGVMLSGERERGR